MEELERTCCSRTACKGKSCLLLKTRNGCCESSETHHVILLTTPNGQSDINRTTDPKHKTSLSWGTKGHFCLSVNPCRELAWVFFFFFYLHWKFPMASSQDNRPLCQCHQSGLLSASTQNILCNPCHRQTPCTGTSSNIRQHTLLTEFLSVIYTHKCEPIK